MRTRTRLPPLLVSRRRKRRPSSTYRSSKLEHRPGDHQPSHDPSGPWVDHHRRLHAERPQFGAMTRGHGPFNHAVRYGELRTQLRWKVWKALWRAAKEEQALAEGPLRCPLADTPTVLRDMIADPDVRKRSA